MHRDGTMPGPRPAVLVVAVVAVTLGAFAPTTAHAAGERFDGRSIALELQAGRAMPLGYYGLSLDVSLSRHLVIAGGLGFTYEGRFGTTPQGMLGSRLRYPFGRGWAVAAGAGLSLGGYVQDTIINRVGLSEQQWLPGLRLNGELSVEYRFASPVAVRVFGGMARYLNDPQCQYIVPGASYVGDCRAPEVPEQYLAFDWTRVYVGAAVAYQLAGDSADRFVPWSERPPAEETGPWQRWYGWQTLAADAANAGLQYIVHRQSPKTEWGSATQGAGVALYLASAPVVHLAQHRPFRSLMSVAARVLLPVVGSLLYSAAVTTPNECSGLDCPFVMGAYIGAAAASITDAGLLAYR